MSMNSLEGREIEMGKVPTDAKYSASAATMSSDLFAPERCIARWIVHEENGYVMATAGQL
jgi:hypothetical protein